MHTSQGKRASCIAEGLLEPGGAEVGGPLRKHESVCGQKEFIEQIKPLLSYHRGPPRNRGLHAQKFAVSFLGSSAHLILRLACGSAFCRAGQQGHGRTEVQGCYWCRKGCRRL